MTRDIKKTITGKILDRMYWNFTVDIILSVEENTVDNKLKDNSVK